MTQRLIPHFRDLYHVQQMSLHINSSVIEEVDWHRVNPIHLYFRHKPIEHKNTENNFFKRKK